MSGAGEGGLRRRRRRLRRRHRVISALLALMFAMTASWGMALWQLRRSVERYRVYWSVPRGETGGLLYVALGDSTAQGIGAGGPERGYVGLLASRLRRSSGGPVQVLNLSRSGARVHDVVAEQLPRLSGLAPDLVTIAVGANDIKDYDSGRFRADVDALIAGLPPRAVVGDVPWFMHAGAGRNSGEAAAYVAARARAAGLAVAPLHAATRVRGWRSMVTDFSPDWFHPNDRGYRLWARAFWEAIETSGLPLGAESGRGPNRGGVEGG